MALALLPTSTDVDFPVLLDNFWVRESKDRQTYAWTSNRLQQRFFFFEIHEETWHDKRQPYFTHNKIHNEALSYLSFPSYFIIITFNSYYLYTKLYKSCLHIYLYFRCYYIIFLLILNTFIVVVVVCISGSLPYKWWLVNAKRKYTTECQLMDR